MIHPYTTLKLKTGGVGVFIFILTWIVFTILFQWNPAYGLYEVVESFFYYQTFRSTAEPNENLIIIDEEDLRYNRSDYADLILGLDQQGAKVIAFDILFAGEDDKIRDERLVKATRTAGSKVIHAAEFYGVEKNAFIPERFRIKTDTNPRPDGFIEGIYGVTLPFAGLLDATRYIGNITARSDITGRAEQYFPLLVYYNNTLYPSLPFLAVLNFLGGANDALLRVTGDSLVYRTNAHFLSIPTDNKSQILINFIQPLKFAGKLISIENALNQMKTNPEIFKSKIILVGNSQESREQTKGPHFQNYPNLIIYATIISQLLNQQNIKEGALESILTGFVLLAVGLVWLFTKKFKRIKIWMVLLLSFFVLLIISALLISIRIKIYIVLPYLVFCLSMVLIKFYFRHGSSRIRTVFISYSSEDFHFAKKINTALIKKGILTIFASEKPSPGKGLWQFIKESVRNSDYTVMVASKNSLKSSWVCAEFVETRNHEHVLDAEKFLPVHIDYDIFDHQYRSKLESTIDWKEYEIMKGYRNNFLAMLEALQLTISLDLSEQVFDKNIDRLIERIEHTK